MGRAQCVLVVALLIGLAHSWDIATTAGDQLEFYTNDRTKIDTVHLKSQNLTALAYDEVHNMLLYVDKQNNNDAICGYNMTSKDYKCYVERNGRNIRSLAFDPVTEILFFTDTEERSINWYSLKPGFKNNVYGNLLMKMDTVIPTDIVVDSCRGYIYWINTHQPKSTIERARFNGSDRKVVFTSQYNMDLHSLAIDLETRRMFFYMPLRTELTYVYRADLNGEDWSPILSLISRPGDANALDSLNSIFISKKFLILFDWCLTCEHVRRPWLFPKLHNNYNGVKYISTKNVVGLAANYKLIEKVQGISNCNHVPNDHLTNELLEIAAKYRPLCVHGIKVSGKTLCKCFPGYTGERCEVSVCENYCLHGNCSLSEDGLPKCSCKAGYSGEQCDVDVCTGYCLNSGNCSLTVDNQPFCQCEEDYVGHRCDKISGCLNYCLKGNCSFSEQGLPECRCEVGYSGERCEVNVCNSYCLNSGVCSLDEADEPACKCVGQFEGERCELPVNFNDCGMRACQCVDSYGGPGRETDKKKTYLEERERNLTIADLLENWRKHAQLFQ